MSFRVKLRIKSVKPCYPVKPAPVSPSIPRIPTDEDLLRRLYEAAKMPFPGDDTWTRRWPTSPGRPDPRFSPTCTLNVRHDPNVMLWNGIAPINVSAVQ